MKKMKKITISAVMAMVLSTAVSTGFAQTNLGVDCGCPPISSRTVVDVDATLTDASGNFTATNTIMTCDKIYRLDQKVYVGDGKTLTIMPGTLVKSIEAPTADLAPALIISMGGKIMAAGEKDCPIVFTADADPMDGTYAYSNRGKWGGIIVCGKATNNLTGQESLGVSAGVGYIEGFAGTDTRIQFGGGTTPDDNDNSGVIKYVSIRHGGAIVGLVSSGNEINGLTLGSVGRGTTIEHIEVISNLDDNIELFGGTVNLKWITTMFGSDDMLDWDMGYTGKVQFFFGIGTPTGDTLANKCDNGIEADNDDKRSAANGGTVTNACPRSHPVIYNATFIGNNKRQYLSSSDETGTAGIMAKELTEGEIYNSIFTNFKVGCVIQQTGTRGAGVCPTVSGGTLNEAYDNWNTGSLIIKNCTFDQNRFGFRFNKYGAVQPSVDDFTKFLITDGNDTTSTPAIAGFNSVWSMVNTPANNTVVTKYDAVPNPAIATTITPPVDGFFSPANYRGAFASSGKSWMADWTYAKLLKVSAGMKTCATDINSDGVTNVSDFGVFLGGFGQTCQ